MQKPVALIFWPILANVLLEYASLLYSSAELIAAFHHIPGSTHNATLKAGATPFLLKSSFFNVNNFTGLGFCDANGKLVVPNVTLNLTTLPSGILYFAFLSCIDPGTQTLASPSTSPPYYYCMSCTTSMHLPSPIQPCKKILRLVQFCLHTPAHTPAPATSPAATLVATPVPTPSPCIPLTVTPNSHLLKSPTSFAASPPL
jgi:hypothetical protein